MEHIQELDASTEAEGRRLLAAAFETVQAGQVLAGDGPAGAELLRRVRQRTSRRRRVRALVPAGAVAALGGQLPRHREHFAGGREAGAAAGHRRLRPQAQARRGDR